MGKWTSVHIFSEFNIDAARGHSLAIVYITLDEVKQVAAKRKIYHRSQNNCLKQTKP